jgi:hypothetical protein
LVVLQKVKDCFGELTRFVAYADCRTNRQREALDSHSGGDERDSVLKCVNRL